MTKTLLFLCLCANVFCQTNRFLKGLLFSKILFIIYIFKKLNIFFLLFCVITTFLNKTKKKFKSMNINNLFFFNYNYSLIKTNYFVVFIFIIFALILSCIILTFSYILSTQNPETEKLSAYECGFEPYEDARHTFDIKFYIVAILFLVFDIETIFIFPWSVVLNLLDTVGFWVMIDFILELGIGFLYVWFINALNW